MPGAKQLSRLSELCDPKREKKTANLATKKDWKFKWFGHRYWSVWVKVFPVQQTEIQRSQHDKLHKFYITVDSGLSCCLLVE